MTSNLKFGYYNNYEVGERTIGKPVYWSDKSVFKLIDEDLTNALQILIPEGNDLIMSEYQKGYNHGYNDGINVVKNQYKDSEANVAYGNSGKNYNLGINEAKQKDSRMEVELIEDVKCRGCKSYLQRTDLVYGVIYEHTDVGFPCEFTGKYIYRKKKIIASE